MTAKFSGRLPKGDANGLAPIAAELLDCPETVHVVLALIDCSKITVDVDNGDRVPTIRIRRIEAVQNADDRDRLRMLLEREFERRTGKTVLPFELEMDVRAAFTDESGPERGGRP